MVEDAVPDIGSLEEKPIIEELPPFDCQSPSSSNNTSPLTKAS